MIVFGWGGYGYSSCCDEGPVIFCVDDAGLESLLEFVYGLSDAGVLCVCFEVLEIVGEVDGVDGRGDYGSFVEGSKSLGGVVDVVEGLDEGWVVPDFVGELIAEVVELFGDAGDLREVDEGEGFGGSGCVHVTVDEGETKVLRCCAG